MIVLGITVNVGSSAALMVDGRIVAASSEERYNRRKNYEGYPASAIEYVLRAAGVDAKDVDHVVWSDVDSMHPDYFLTHRYSTFSVADFVREQEEFWYPRLYGNKNPDFLDLFRDRLVLDQFPGPDSLAGIAGLADFDTRYSALERLRTRMVEMHIGIAPAKTVFLNHHKCHAAYAACAYASSGTPLLVCTMDGSGDGENATVWLWTGTELQKLAGTDQMLVGRYYRHTTLLLGMRMAEHEFKVMGLAPYAKPYYADKPFQVFRDALSVKNLQIGARNKPRDAYFHFKEQLKACRFDGIAAGLQRFTEETLCDWVGGWMERTGVTRVAYSGGVSMNVKANLSLLERCAPGAFLVPGSGTDDSLAIGACYLFAIESGQPVLPLESMYLGDSITPEQVSAGLSSLERGRYEVREHVGNAEIAQLLASGKILGRCVGRMEFGARALGNRSVLADPRNPDVIRTINDKIKSRDFWMPFAPTILDRAATRYLKTHAGANYTGMSLAAESTAEGRSAIRAALHPADLTARPQVLNEDSNPAYYDLIARFAHLTGVDALLNTSLNLHGLPIVRTVEDALHVLRNSAIDGLVVGEALILRHEAR